MQRFYHNELKELEQLLQALNLVLEKYNSRDTDVLPALHIWLDKTIAVCKKLAKTDAENRALGWKAELITAQRNINPITMEKVNLQRYQMQTTIAFKIMQAAAAQLQTDLQACKARLQEAGTLTGQIVAAGIQAGIITDGLLDAADDQAGVEAIWKVLRADPNILLGQKKLLLLVSRFDVWLLLSEVLASVAEPV